MWFKNLRIYRFTKPFEWTAEALEPVLAERAFKPCGRQDLTQYGWVSPLGDGHDTFTHSSNGNIILCAQRQDKIVPSSVIKDAMQEKIDLIEQRDARKVYRKEKDQIKDEVLLELLPRAFTRNNRLFAYVAPKEGLLLLDTASPSKAEEFLSYLRETLNGLPVIPPVAKNVPADVMTHWLNTQQAEDPFTLDRDCELNNPLDTGNVIRCKGQDLDSDEIRQLLDAGKRCNKLAVVWKDAIRCVISEDLSLKRLKFEDELLQQANESDAESREQQFDQDFNIMAVELNQLCADLFKVFGGLEAESSRVV